MEARERRAAVAREREHFVAQFAIERVAGNRPWL
jgi:hypothetical protein